MEVTQLLWRLKAFIVLVLGKVFAVTLNIRKKKPFLRTIFAFYEDWMRKRSNVCVYEVCMINRSKIVFDFRKFFKLPTFLRHIQTFQDILKRLLLRALRNLNEKQETFSLFWEKRKGLQLLSMLERRSIS